MAQLSGYRKVDERIIAQLKNIVGEKNVIFEDREKMEQYAYDEGFKTDPRKHEMPEVVVKATSTEQVARIMKLANEEHIAVTPRGAGSGLTGGAMPVAGGIVLSFEKMNRILELDKENMMVTLEPGVITNELNHIIEQDGLFFAGYPMSAETCFIGGNVAENAGGGRAIKYGVTSHYVLGLEVVLPSGEIINLGGKLLKDVTGYNLLQLIIGSEGTLGLVTKVILKLLPLPKARAVMMAFFEDLPTTINTATSLIQDLKIIPSSLEFMDDVSIDTTYTCLNEKKPCAEMKALLLVEVDGADQDTVRQQTLDIGDYLLENGALDAIMAETPGEQERLWKVRSFCGEALFAISDLRLAEDLVVPPASIPALVSGIKKIGSEYNVSVACMGHVGDGNVHAILSKVGSEDLEQWDLTQKELLSHIYKLTTELGGIISGEHGVGHKRLEFMPLVTGENELDLMRKIKSVFDPNNVLNPGKIVRLNPGL